MTRLAPRALVAAAALSAIVTAQQTVFRSGVDVVIVDVAVLDRNKPVADLTAEDFVVRDNGVRQTVAVIPSASVPVDLTLAVDTSGSMASAMAVVKTQVEAAVSTLGTQDQLRMLTFASGVVELFPMQRPTANLPFEKFTAGGGTSLYDALAAALMRQRRPDRGDLAVVLTDTLDSASAMTMKTVQDLARRSDVLLYVYVVRSGVDVTVDARWGRADYGPLRELAATTGGQLEVILADNQVATAITRTLAEFHSRYTLWYTATGVARGGWHELSVTLTRPARFDVRARKGYFGG